MTLARPICQKSHIGLALYDAGVYWVKESLVRNIRLKSTVKYLVHCSSERFGKALRNALPACSGASDFVTVNFSFTIGKRKKSHGDELGEYGEWATNWMEFCWEKSIACFFRH